MAQSEALAPPWVATRTTSVVVTPAISATCTNNDIRAPFLEAPKALSALDAPIQARRSAGVKSLVPLGHPNKEREEKPQMARPEPLYIRPANWVRQQIRDGVLAPGMSAPTERELAKQFGV